MSRATATVVVRGENGEPFVILAGNEIPKWADAQIGDHVRVVDKPKVSEKPAAATRHSR